MSPMSRLLRLSVVPVVAVMLASVGVVFAAGAQAQPSPLPTSFQWQSSGQLIAPKSDATHNIRAVKDPSVVYHNGRYHVFFSTVTTDGAYNLGYLNFTDFSQAGAAQHHYLDQTAIGGGYKAAPHVFYFAPEQRWYLVYQTGSNAAYSTTTNISDPQSWSAPQVFYPNGMPQIIQDNIGDTWWVDFWVVCDSAMCYLFSSDGNGHLYRSQTTLANFPTGFTNTVIAMEHPDRYPLWEAVNVYKVDASNTYLVIVEAIGSNGRRWFRSWTAPAIAGPYTPLADTEANPFARSNNVTFNGTAWTQDISHGEMIRSGVDQNMTISPCDMRYLYQGMDPSSSDPYNMLPWRLGLLTQTNSTCNTPPPPSPPPPSTPPPSPSPPSSPPPSGNCEVGYAVNAWNTGLTASVTITNTSTSAVNGWSLAFTLPSGQTITNGWNANYSPTSGAVTATNASWNGTINPGVSVTVGFQASHTGNTGEPASFTLNGSACTVA